MTFRDITNKNFNYNLRKFTSYFLVNAFVVCVLFLFGSLLFNDVLNADEAIRSAQSLIVMAASGIIVFSVIFLTYTGHYFIRSRSREFGVYLTLGMTPRDLARLVAREGAKIFVAAAALGLAAALLIGKLFYLALAKMLGVSQDLFFISYKTFMLSLGVLLVTFVIQRLAAARFIRKLSIVEITKANKTKGMAKQRPLAGIAALLVFIASLVVFHEIVAGADWIKGFLRENMVLSLGVLVTVMLISMFFMVGSAVAGVAWICRRFPALYQRNILLLSGLAHRFRAYRVSLYSVSLLVAFAVFFIGIGMSLYIYGETMIDTFQPYDFMVEQRGAVNNVGADELREMVRNGGGEIESIRTLPYLDCQVYKEMKNRGDLFLNDRRNFFLVSESDFNRYMGRNVSVKPDELLIVTNQEEAVETGVTFDTVVVAEPFAPGIARADAFRENSVSKSEFLQGLDGVAAMEYAQENTWIMFQPFVNSHGALEFVRSYAYVVDDEVYDSVLASQVNGIVNGITVFDLASGDPSAVMAALLAGLSKRNGLPEDAWREPTEYEFMNRDNMNALRPISSWERHDILLRANGFLLFAMAFLGLLFLASSCIVLYYKLAADTDEESEHIELFRKIGLTARESRSYLQTHLAIIFFLPLLLGGVLGLYLTYQFIASIAGAWFLLSRVAIMYGVIVLFAAGLYASLRKRFFRAVRL